MKSKSSTKKAMRILSLLLAASLFLGTQGFTVFAETISGNGTAAAGSKEQENDGEGGNSQTEPEAVDTEIDSTYLEDSTNQQQEMLPDSNVSENNARVGEGGPQNPVHHCALESGSTDYTDFSYVYFGAYPQSEVTDSATIAAIDNAIAMSGTREDAEMDAGIDVWVNGTKYRRISKDDTNYGYFFDYMPTNNGYRYFKWQRIKWRVLENDGNTLFVIADKIVDCKDYNDLYSNTTWSYSTIRYWLNNSFYNTAFSNDEQSAVATQMIVNEDNPFYGTKGGTKSRDNIYLLSISEAKNPIYGFCSSFTANSMSRKMKTSDYANARGMWTEGIADYEYEWNWWLRSPGGGDDCIRAAAVKDGEIIGGGYYVNYSQCGVCPVLHINLSSDTWFMATGEADDEGEYVGVLAPEASIKGGTYFTSQKIELASATEGAEIYYTTDGSTPGKENGISYTGKILVQNPITLKAVAVKDGMVDSQIMEETYKFSAPISETITIPAPVLGENASGTVENEEVLQFFPGNFSLSSTLVPISASHTVETNGSHTLKVAIGIKEADWLDKSSEWNNFKESVKTLQESQRRIDAMESLCKAFGGDTVSFFESEKIKAKPEVSVLGYYEYKIDKDNKVITNSGMLQTDAKWKASCDWQFFTPIGPMYISIEGSGKITGKLGLSYEYEDDGAASFLNGTWEKQGEVTLTPGLSLEGGYGVAKIATIGASGSAEVPIQIYPASKADFDAAASVHVYIIFILDATWDLATYHINLWDTTNDTTNVISPKGSSRSGISQGDVADMQLNPEDLKPVDRSYAEHTTSWQGNTASSTDTKSLSARAGAEGETAAGETEHVLQSGIMPNSLPAIKQIGNDTVMVFQANDASRNTLDSSVLMYSVYRSGTWSEPVPVWDNGTCDMYADLQVINDDLYLVWQKENARIAENGENGEQILSRMAEKSEICFAKYDQEQKKFVDVTYITSDKKVDMMPKLATNGNKVTAVWITNSENSFLQEEGTNRIVYADWEDGAFSEEKVLCEMESGIEEFAPYYADDTLYAAYVSNISQENAANQAFLSTVNGGDKEVSDGSTLTSNLQWQDGVLYYYEGGTMKAYDMAADELSTITAGESPISANGKIFVNDGKTAVLWSAPDQVTGTSKVYSSVKTAEGFSKPIALYSTDSSIKYLDGVLNADGSWQFMMNTAKTGSQEQLHSLVFVTKEEAPEIEVESITVDDAAKENEATPISYMVTNTSEETITSLVLTIEGENGFQEQQDAPARAGLGESANDTADTEGGNGFWKQQNIPVSIAPGETVYDTVDVDLAEVTDTTNVNITLCAQGQANTRNNTVEAVIGQTDLTLEAAMIETEEDVCIVATVSNNSMIPADATLTLYEDVEQTRQIETVPMGEISKEEGGSHTFYLKKSSLTMNENGAVYMPLVVTSDKTDSNEDNNRVIEIAYATLEDPDEKGEGGTTEGGTTEGGTTEGGTTEGGDKKEGSTDNRESIKVTQLTITAPSKKLAAGKKVKLTLGVAPANAANKEVSWETSNKKYATIDKNGMLTLKKAGAGKTVTVTATAKDGSGKKATIKIKIMKHAVKSVKLKAPSKTLKAGKTMTVKATVKTTGKSVNKTLKWQSSNTKYATVNQKGKVTAKKAGKGKTVTITAVSTDGSNKKAKVKIKIK